MRHPVCEHVNFGLPGIWLEPMNDVASAVATEFIANNGPEGLHMAAP